MSINASSLKAYRESIGLSQEEFAKKLGLTRGTYKNYEVKTPIPAKIEAILYAKGYSDVSQIKLTVPQQNTVMPYLGEVTEITMIDTDELTDPSETIAVPIVFAGKNRRCCKIISDHCYPDLVPGDLAIFQLDNVPKIGRFALLKQQSDKLAITFTLLKHDGKEYLMQPTNSNYEARTLAPWIVAGYLVGYKREDGEEITIRFNPNGIRSDTQ